MTYEGFDKVVRDKGFNITKNLKFDGYQRVLASMVYKCFNKNSILPIDKSRISWIIKNLLLENLKNKKYTHLL